MSDKDESTPFSFSAADLMPEWAQESKKSEKPQKKRTQHQERDSENRQDRGGPRRDNRGGQQGDRRGGGGDRRDFGGDRRGGGQGRGRPGGRGRDDRNRGGRGRGGRDGGRERREDPIPSGFTLKFGPTPVALKALNKHIRESFRTYPLIDLAKMIINSRDRYQIEIKADSEKGAKLFQCKSDGSIWLSREEAMSHFFGADECLKNYYSVEEVEIGTPKGNFSTVAVCGMSGVILGPPNHHQYQAKIAQLHAERFSHMALEGFKSRINMASDEETIEKWKEQVSRTLHYRLKSDEPEEVPEAEEKLEEEAVVEITEAGDEAESENVAETAEETPAEEAAIVDAEPEDQEAESEEVVDEESDAGDETDESDAEEPDEPVEDPTPVPEAKEEDSLLLKTQEELRLHFKENFAAEEITETDRVSVNGNIPGKLLSSGLLNLIKKESEQLRRGFPLPMIQALCSGFEKHRLRFFKRGKKSLHVSAVRPKALSKSVTLSDRIQKILDLVSAPQRCDVSGLLEAMVEDFKKPTTKEEADKMELSDASKEVLTDLRWLTSEGLVLEFPDTRLVLGKMPQQQAKPKKKAAQKKSPKQKKGDEEVKAESKEDDKEEITAKEEDVKAENPAAKEEAKPEPDQEVTKKEVKSESEEAEAIENETKPEPAEVKEESPVTEDPTESEQ